MNEKKNINLATNQSNHHKVTSPEDIKYDHIFQQTHTMNIGNQQLQQQIEQQHQQRAIIQEQQQIHAAGSFNGQGYEAPSNNGHYGGPSSYEVQLNSYTRAIWCEHVSQFTL